MIKKLKTLLFTSLTAITLMVPAVAMPVAVHAATADIESNLCAGANLQVSSNPDCSSSTNAVSTVNNTIARVINIFSFVVGVIAVIMIIIGGIRFVLSGGDSANVTAARNTILYAIVGLVIVALAQIIVKFVLNRTSTIG